MHRAWLALTLAGSLHCQESRTTPWADVEPLLRKVCFECHGDGSEREGDLDLEARPFLADRARTIAVLREMRARVAQGEMPPPDSDVVPTPKERAELVKWIGARLHDLATSGELEPGRVTMRRLSRAEYANVVRDLFGVRDDVTRGFPADDLGFGFDNVGAAATFSVLHFEKYLAAASRVAARALGLSEPRSMRHFEAETLDVSRSNPSVFREWLCLCSPGPAVLVFESPRPGRWSLGLRAAAQPAGPEPPRLRVTLDGRSLFEHAITATANEGERVEFEFACGEGRHELGFDFPNDYWNPSAADPADRDRNLLLDWIELAGPLDPAKAPPESAWLLGADPGTGTLTERVRPVVTELAHRAWRRPPRSDEVLRLTGLVTGSATPGEPLAKSLAVAVEAVLASPNFLFRPEPVASADAKGKEALGDLELATRLAFFLWSSTPDPELLARAERGEFHDAVALVAQARRMLASDRTDALARNFAAQWLELRQLDQVAPDKKRFPTWSKDLRADLREETERLFLAVLREGRDVRDLVAPTFTFLNERLARHYGIPGVVGREWRRVELTDPQRGGILAQASVLAVTSNPTRTSPVKRGKWVLENLLDQAPPPPPPGNDSFKAEQLVKDAKSLRAQMAVHRANPACATCHVRMDALGLALESFDAIGRWRTSEGGEPIDTSGTLPDGTKLAGIVDLKRLVRDDPAFVRCLLEKLFVYAIGRGPTADDEALLDVVAGALPADEITLTDLVLAIVGSEPFRMRSTRS